MAAHADPEITLRQMEISPFCDKVRRVLHYKGLPYETREISLMGLGGLSKIAPPGKVPVLSIGKRNIWDSTDICLALEEAFPTPPLIPKDPRARADTLLLEDWADEALYFFEMTMRFVWTEERERWSPKLAQADSWPIRRMSPWIVSRLTRKITHLQGTGRKSRDEIRNDLRRHFASLEARIGKEGFCVGADLSLADIAVAVQIHCISGTSEGQRLLNEHPTLADWKRCVDEMTVPGGDDHTAEGFRRQSGSFAA